MNLFKNKILIVVAGITLSLASAGGTWFLVRQGKAPTTPSVSNIQESPSPISPLTPTELPEVYSCDYWRNKDFGKYNDPQFGIDYAGAVTIEAKVRRMVSPAAWEENKNVTAVFLEIVPQIKEPQKTFYEIYRSLIREGNTINQSENNLLLFKVGILEMENISSTATIMESMYTRLLQATHSGATIIANLVIPIHLGAEAPENFSFACSIG